MQLKLAMQRWCELIVILKVADGSKHADEIFFWCRKQFRLFVGVEHLLTIESLRKFVEFVVLIRVIILPALLLFIGYLAEHSSK